MVVRRLIMEPPNPMMVIPRANRGYRTALKCNWLGLSVVLMLGFLGSCANGRVNTLADLGDLRQSDSELIHSLAGDWQFAPDILLRPHQALEYTGYTPVEVPGSLSAGITSGSYLVELQLPPDTDTPWGIFLPEVRTAYRAFVFDTQGNQIEWSVGKVSRARELAVPQILPWIENLPSSRQPVWLLIQVSDFHSISPGLISAPLVGPQSKLFALQKGRDMLTASMAGIFLVIGFFFIILSWDNKMVSASRDFGFFTMSIALRVLLVDRVVWQWFSLPSELVYTILLRLEILTFYTAVPFIYLFIQGLFPHEVTPKLRKFTWSIAGIFILGLLVPGNLFLYMRIAYQGFALLILTYVIVRVFLAAARKRTGARITIASYIFAFGTVINDILLANGLIRSVILSPVGLLMFILTQAIVLSFYYVQVWDILVQTNAVSSYFVPKELLQLIGINDIVEARLGLGIEKDMTVLFADIRSYTKLSEKMKPSENYEFLNSYLETIGPSIREYGGIVDKFLGDGIMALFPGKPLDAVMAAQKMTQYLSEFNHHRSDHQQNTIHVGIGIHFGKVILGTLGEKERMEVTVISDTVNGASRISDLTKLFDSQVLLSGTIYSRLPADIAATLRYLGKFRVRGKDESLDIYESAAHFGKKYFASEAGKLFAEGVQAYLDNDTDRARVLFDNLMKLPDGVDGASLYYQSLLQKK